jgi:hypothetical protein
VAVAMALGYFADKLDALNTLITFLDKTNNFQERMFPTLALT